MREDLTRSWWFRDRRERFAQLLSPSLGRSFPTGLLPRCSTTTLFTQHALVPDTSSLKALVALMQSANMPKRDREEDDGESISPPKQPRLMSTSQFHDWEYHMGHLASGEIPYSQTPTEHEATQTSVQQPATPSERLASLQELCDPLKLQSLLDQHGE